MALSAVFQADFSKWDSALRNAQQNLKAFEVSGKGVQRQLQRLSESFSGVQIKKQADLAVAAVRAVGGASKLTEAEQRKVNATVTEAIAKYAALGQQAPADMRRLQAETAKAAKETGFLSGTVGKLGVAFAGLVSVQAFAGLASKALELGGSLSDLSAKTGIGVRALQEFQFAGGQVGVSLDQITSAINQMQNRIAEGDKSAVGAMRRLNISVAEFKNLKPEDQFAKVADAIGEIEDPAERVRTAMDLMGKSGAELLPVLTKGFNDAREAARSLGVVLDEETVDALDTMGDRLDALQSVGLAGFARLLVELEPLLSVLGAGVIDAGKALDYLQDQFEMIVLGALRVNSDLANLEVRFHEFSKSVNPMASALGVFDAALADSKRRAEDARLTWEGMADSMRRSAVIALLAAQKLRDVDVRGDTGSTDPSSVITLRRELEAARKAMAALTAEQRANIRAGIDLHKSHEDIAEAIGVSTEVVKLYDDALKKSAETSRRTAAEAKAAAKKLAADVKAGLKEVAKFHREAAIENAKIYQDEANKRADITIAEFSKRVSLEKEADREFRKIWMTETQFKLDELQRWADAEKVGIDKSIIGWENHYEQIERVAGAKMLAIIEDTDEWRLAMVQLGSVFPPLLAYLDQLEDKTSAAAKAGKSFGQVFRKNIEQSIGNISDIIVNSLIQGSSFEETAAATAAEIGSSIGASIGFAIGGPLGAAIGDAVGSLLGPLVEKLIVTRAEKTVKRVAYEFGVSISEELAQGIEDEAERQFGGNRQAAKIFNLDKIIAEGGGLTAGNVRQLFARFRDLFTMVETGAFSSAQAIEVLDENFRTFADFVTKGGSMASRDLLEIIRLTREAGLASAEVTEFVQGQLGRAFQGVNALAASFLSTLDGNFEQVGMSILSLVDKEERLAASIADLQKKDHLSDKQRVQLKQWQRELAATRDELAELRREQQQAEEVAMALASGSQEQFDRLGRIALATFNAGLSSGLSLVDVLRQLQPGLQALQDSLVFGLEASQPIADLLGLSQFVTENAEVIDAVAGLNDVMQGLHNSAFLTQETFTDLGLEAARQFEELTVRGLEADDALRVMQPTLQTLWELQEDFGYSVDASTQALLEEAEAAGVVGEKHRTAQEQMLRLQERMTTAIEGLAELFGVVLPDAVGEFGEALDSIPDPVIRPKIDWPDVELPEGFPSSGYSESERRLPNEGSGQPGFASGTPGLGFMDFGTGRSVTLHGREMVVPEDRLGEVVAKYGGGSVTVNVTIQAWDGSDVARVVKSREFSDAFVDGLSKNTNQLRTRSRSAIGV